MLTRNKRAVIGRKLTAEERLKIPFSENGEYLLIAMLNVHNRYKPQSLHTLLIDHYKEILRELKKLSRQRYRYHKQYFHRTRKELGLAESKRPLRIPVDEMLEPLRTEIQTYQSLVESFGENKSLENQRQEEFFAEIAAHYGITLYKNRVSSVKETIRVSELFYGKIFPLIQGSGMTNISVKDLMLIQTDYKIIAGKEVPVLFNDFINHFRLYEREKISRFKRRGFDSQNYRLLIGRIKRIAIFSGYFSLIEDFNKAYSKLYLDTWLIDHRKAVKKRIYSIEYLDEQIELLRPQFERIIEKRTYIIRPGRSVDARADLNLCLFYLTVVLIRYLSYRQQCVRHCIYDTNIIFAKDESITLAWSKDEVKNKKPRVMTR